MAEDFTRLWLYATAFDMDVVVLFCFVFIVVLAYRKSRMNKKFPPGPKGLPFLGNCGYVNHNNKLHHTFSKLAEHYGPIVGLQLGWYPAILLTDYKLIRKAFNGQPDIYSDRANHIFFRWLIGMDSGVVNGNGEAWRHHRTLAITSLKNFGIGKSSMENVIQEETSVLIKYIDDQHGKPFEITNAFNKATSNVICSLIFGERFPHDSKEYEALLYDIKCMLSAAGITSGLFLLLPYLFPSVLVDFDIVNTLVKWRHMQHFLRKKIAEHRDTFDADNIRDFLDLYLESEQKQVQQEVSWSRHLFSYVISGVSVRDRNLFVTIMDLFIAGSETVATTLRWGMLYFLHYPDIQEKCRKEILQKIGNKKPCLDDRELLPYMEATILEIQRLSCSVPHAALHCTSTEVNFEGYNLPAQTIVIPNIYTIHRDPKLWGDPESFRPERFLDSNGKVLKPPYFMTFSTGKRMCFGEKLAGSEMFLFLVSMLQRFQFTCEDTSTLPPVHGGIHSGVILSPDSYNIIAKNC